MVLLDRCITHANVTRSSAQAPTDYSIYTLEALASLFVIFLLCDFSRFPYQNQLLVQRQTRLN